jgi:Fe(3+) dicitrate transport protein
VFVGHTFTRSMIHTSLNYRGKELPWYPRHEVWAGLGYALPWRCSFIKGVEGDDECRALTIGGDVEWSDTQFSDFLDTVEEPYYGAVGLIPAFTLVDAYARFRVLLPRYWALNLTVGVKNALDAEWFYRTDDINEGILPQRPRTFYLTIDVKHWFFDAQQRAGERRDGRKLERRRRRNLQS